MSQYSNKLEHEDFRLGIITSTLINIHRDPKKGKQIEWYEMFPHWKEKYDARARQLKEENLKLYLMALSQMPPSQPSEAPVDHG